MFSGITQNKKQREFLLFILSAAWGAILIILFAAILFNDTNAPNPDSKIFFSYIIHTDRGSFFSGMVGPIYTITNTLKGKDTGVILDDTWGQGSGPYKFGFVTGSILLITGLGPFASLAAFIKIISEAK